MSSLVESKHQPQLSSLEFDDTNIRDIPSKHSSFQLNLAKIENTQRLNKLMQ
jgi:hypothetical protein